MSDPTRGLYNKFDVRRVDGSSEPGGKHHGCEYFVLDLTHDKHARAALLAYADSCGAEYPLLARDLRAKVNPTGAECEDCHAPAGTVCSDLDCPGMRKTPNAELSGDQRHAND